MWHVFGGQHHGVDLNRRAFVRRCGASDFAGRHRADPPLRAPRPGRFATEILPQHRRHRPRQRSDSVLGSAFRWAHGVSRLFMPSFTVHRARSCSRTPRGPELKRKHGKKGNLRRNFAEESPRRTDDRSSGTPHKGYTFVRPLKRGGMSMAVHVIKKRATGELFVEKRVSLRNRSITERVKSELQTLKRLSGTYHPNLNRLIEHLWLTQNGYCSFVLSYCEKGSLDSLIHQTRNAGMFVSESFVWRVLIHTANGLAFMHWGIHNASDYSEQRKPGWDAISHLDLKPQNLFVKDAPGHPHGIIVIGDFGCSVSLSDKQSGRADPKKQECGTPVWFPPEGLEHIVGRGRTSYGPPTDIFMLGATCHTLCKKTDLPNRDALIKPDPRKIAGKRYSDKMKEWMAKCCRPDLRNRPTAFEIVRRLLQDGKIAKYARHNE